MAPGDIVSRVTEIASRIAASYGLDIFDVQFRREASGMVLRVRIDRPGGGATEQDSVSVDDCARISRDLSAIFDVDDVVPTQYTLEVSSPGLDRPLRHADDYRRFTGRRAKLVMREKIDGQGYFKGELRGLEDGSGDVVLIEGEDRRTHRVPLDVIKAANLVVDF